MSKALAALILKDGAKKGDRALRRLTRPFVRDGGAELELMKSQKQCHRYQERLQICVDWSEYKRVSFGLD